MKTLSKRSVMKYRLMFRALGDGTRLRLLLLLTGSERCVFELQGQLNIDQPSTSRHLRILREAGLVRSQRNEKRVYYSLSLDGVMALRRFSSLLDKAQAEQQEK